MNVPLRPSLSIATLLVMSLLASSGCADPRFDRASQKRMARIHQRVGDWRQREAQGPPRLAGMQTRVVQSLDRHRDRFQKDIVYVNAVMQREIDRWPARRRRQAQFVRDYLDGDIQRADRTIPRLIY